MPTKGHVRLFFAKEYLPYSYKQTHTHKNTHIFPTNSGGRVGGIQFQNVSLPYLPSPFLCVFFFTCIFLANHSRVAKWKLVRVCLCMHSIPPSSYVRSLRKFQFPQDKLHFTANLFPALVLRKSVSRTPSYHPSFIL